MSLGCHSGIAGRDTDRGSVDERAREDRSVEVMTRIVARLRGSGLLLIVVAVLLAGFATPASAARPYTALGDSYTAGPLIPNQTGQPPGCMRSDRNYPHLVAAARNLSLTDVSCSGATTDDMFSPQKLEGEDNDAQLDAVRRDTGVVTLGIGGNDIGFTSIVENCTAVSPNGPTKSGYQYCEDYYHRNGYDELARRIAETQPKVERVLAGIRTKAPGANVYLRDYPAVLPPRDLTLQSTREQCWPQMPVTYRDIPYLRATQERLNAMLKSAAANKGATFVATYPGSVDHNACSNPLTRYIEPLTPTSPAAPVHPNARGEAYMADVVRAAIRK
jgi:GDSL-like Lipase/Acylhydrolase family